MFDTIIMNGVLISFPFLVYIFYIAFNCNISNREKDIFFILTIITSYLFLMRFGYDDNLILLLLNIPIYFAIRENHYIITILLAIITILYNDMSMFTTICLGINYLIILIDKKLIKQKLLFFYTYILINSVTSILIFNNHYIVAIFAILICVVSSLYDHGIKMLEFNIEYKELQKEKQIRMSLFKITHEIKNPIAVCKAYLDMYDVNNKEQGEKYVPIIRSEIERLLCLLEDFLLVNKANVKCEIMDINLLLEEKIKNINELLNKEHINIKYEYADDEIFVMGDYNRLSQVIINLVKNSIEANPNNIFIKCDIKDSNVVINIKDDGTGIESKILSKIKEPFYTTKIKGTGLGVSLSNEIIEAHNGKLNYSSEYGNGTNVEIMLPMYQL